MHKITNEKILTEYYCDTSNTHESSYNIRQRIDNSECIFDINHQNGDSINPAQIDLPYYSYCMNHGQTSHNERDYYHNDNNNHHLSDAIHSLNGSTNQLSYNIDSFEQFKTDEPKQIGEKLIPTINNMTIQELLVNLELEKVDRDNIILQLAVRTYELKLSKAMIEILKCEISNLKEKIMEDPKNEVFNEESNYLMNKNANQMNIFKEELMKLKYQSEMINTQIEKERSLVDAHIKTLEMEKCRLEESNIHLTDDNMRLSKLIIDLKEENNRISCEKNYSFEQERVVLIAKIEELQRLNESFEKTKQHNEELKKLLSLKENENQRLVEQNKQLFERNEQLFEQIQQKNKPVVTLDNGVMHENMTNNNKKFEDEDQLNQKIELLNLKNKSLIADLSRLDTKLKTLNENPEKSDLSSSKIRYDNDDSQAYNSNPCEELSKKDHILDIMFIKHDSEDKDEGEREVENKGEVKGKLNSKKDDLHENKINQLIQRIHELKLIISHDNEAKIHDLEEKQALSDYKIQISQLKDTIKDLEKKLRNSQNESIKLIEVIQEKEDMLESQSIRLKILNQVQTEANLYSKRYRLTEQELVKTRIVLQEKEKENELLLNNHSYSLVVQSTDKSLQYLDKDLMDEPKLLNSHFNDYPQTLKETIMIIISLLCLFIIYLLDFGLLINHSLKRQKA